MNSASKATSELARVRELLYAEPPFSARWKRLMVALSILEEHPTEKALQRAKVSRTTYFAWRKRYAKGGLQDLLSRSRRDSEEVATLKDQAHLEESRPSPQNLAKEADSDERIQPKLDDVAKKANVSKCTASLALRHSHKISPATTKRVLEAADELGYRPNPLVGIHMAHIRNTRSEAYRSTLGFLIDFTEAKNKTRFNKFCKPFFETAAAHARRIGYKLEVFHFNDPSVSNSRLRQILLSRGIRGLIFPELASNRGKLDFDLNGFACSHEGYTIWDPFDLHRVCADTYNIMMKTLNEVKSRGYKRIGIVSTDDKRSNFLVSSAIRTFQLGLPDEEKVTPLIASSERINRESFHKWRAENEMDAIVSWTDIGYSWLKEQGYQFPDDIGYASVFVQSSFPELSGLNLNLPSHGPAAVDLVVSQLQSNESGIPLHPKTVIMQGVWHEGETLCQTDDSTSNR